MATEPSEKDPSMDEILQSIKRIISEDESPSTEEDVLELTDLVQDDGSVVDIRQEMAVQEVVKPVSSAERAADNAPAHDLLGEIDSFSQPEVPPMPDVSAPAEVQEEVPVMEAVMREEPTVAYDNNKYGGMEKVLEPLISEEVARVTVNKISELKTALEAEDEPEAPVMDHALAFRSGTTVEDIIIETMRPILKNWLESNLPGMVEGIVEREIERIVRSS